MNKNTLLIVAAAAVGVYLITRPKYPVGVNPATGLPYTATQYPGQYPAYNPYLPQQNSTAQIITASGSVLDGLGDLFDNIFN